MLDGPNRPAGRVWHHARMPTYVALLRGINVGRNKQVAVAAEVS